jgi:hypothetical protein
MPVSEGYPLYKGIAKAYRSSYKFLNEKFDWTLRSGWQEKAPQSKELFLAELEGGLEVVRELERKTLTIPKEILLEEYSDDYHTYFLREIGMGILGGFVKGFSTSPVIVKNAVVKWSDEEYFDNLENLKIKSRSGFWWLQGFAYRDSLIYYARIIEGNTAKVTDSDLSFYGDRYRSEFDDGLGI